VGPPACESPGSSREWRLSAISSVSREADLVLRCSGVALSGSRSHGPGDLGVMQHERTSALRAGRILGGRFAEASASLTARPCTLGNSADLLATSRAGHRLASRGGKVELPGLETTVGWTADHRGPRPENRTFRPALDRWSAPGLPRGEQVLEPTLYPMPVVQQSRTRLPVTRDPAEPRSRQPTTPAQ
jgi:hypothetical protein